jgi:hypothetical protein
MAFVAVLKFLELVSTSQMMIDSKLSWLSHFLRDCLSANPDVLPVVADWAYQTSRALETER